MPHTLKFPSSLLQRLTSLRGLALFSVGCCALLSQDSATAQDTKEPKKVTAIYVVAKTHFDLGFTDQAENVFHRYRVEMMNSALKVMEATATLPKDQQFAWTVPGWPIAAQMLGPKQDPARKARIEQVLRNGLLVMHALPFTAHTESLELEDLVRGLDFSRAIARKYGLPLPLAAKMTDVPSHSWVLPTLLSHAGVRFLHLGCNPASQTPRVPALFWWEVRTARGFCAATRLIMAPG